LPHLTEIAVEGNREHPEYRQSIKLARLLALATGFRTCRKCGGEDDLPDDRTLLLSAYDEYTSEKEHPLPAPLVLDIADGCRPRCGIPDIGPQVHGRGAAKRFLKVGFEASLSDSLGETEP